MQFRNALLAGAAMLALPLAANAEPLRGVYIGAGAGASFLADQSVERAGSISTKGGAMGTLSVGYGLGNGFRVEVQGDFRENKLHDAGGLRAGGHQRQYGAFVNAYYDIDLGDRAFGLTPYVGAGIGYQRAEFDRGLAYGSRGGVPVSARTSDSDGGLALQAIAGVSYDVPSVPGLAVTGEYRFTAMTGDMRFDARGQGPSGATRTEFRTESNDQHAAIIGLRYAFNAPMPTPQRPVPAVVEHMPSARTYLVFFNHDSAELGARARQIVADAAGAAQKDGVTRIEVSGHTDRSGSERYNEGLSRRRAEAVSRALVAAGVDRASIGVTARGETAPIVPTADGVREPQNRRVEIVLR